MAEKVKTGGIAHTSGQYRVNGGKTEITLVKDKRVPPAGGKAATFTLVDATKHKK